MAEATIVKNAMSGLGTKERLIYPVICGRENEEIVKLKATYFSMFSEDMSIKLAGELGGDFERMIFWCLQGLEKEYDTDFFSDEKVEADAEAFHKAGEGSFGTDEASLFRIIGESPAQHLEKVNSVYVDKYEITLIGALNKEVGGDAGRAARYAVGMKLKVRQRFSRKKVVTVRLATSSYSNLFISFLKALQDGGAASCQVL
jgi:hypothetical protein